MEVLLVGAQRLDPGHRGGEVAAPGVDEQLLEGRVDLARSAAAPSRRASRSASSPASSSSTRLTSVATSQSASRAMVWPTAAGEVDGHVEVDRRPRRRCPSSVETRLGVGGGEGASRRCSGKPSARHSRRASSIVTPVSAATSRALKVGLLAQDRLRRALPGSRAGAGRPPRRCVRRHRRGGRRVGEAGAARRRPAAAPARRAGCRGAATLPCVLASETTSVPQPKSRSIRPISKSTPLIRLSGIVRPSLAMKPERLMKRRLVNV